MRRPAAALLASLLVTGAISARAQEEDPSQAAAVATPAADDSLVLTATGHVEAISSGVVLEYIVRVGGEDGASAEKKFSKKLKALVKAMDEDAPVTTLITVDAKWAPRFQANGFVFKPQFGTNPPFKTEPGATFTGRFLVGIHDIQKVSPDLARRRISQVMAKLGENELTGAEDDVDIIAAHLEVDAEGLRLQSEADAMEKARRRARALALLAGRKLGRASLLHESYSLCDDEQIKWGSNYFNFVFPGSTNGWTAPLTVSCDTELYVSFELE